MCIRDRVSTQSTGEATLRMPEMNVSGAGDEIDNMDVAEVMPRAPTASISRVMSAVRQDNPVLRTPISFDSLNAEYGLLNGEQKARLEQAFVALIEPALVQNLDALFTGLDSRQSNYLDINDFRNHIEALDVAGQEMWRDISANFEPDHLGRISREGFRTSLYRIAAEKAAQPIVGGTNCLQLVAVGIHFNQTVRSLTEGMIEYLSTQGRWQSTEL
eukprot:TRINITY_DN9958_c0_g1_i3.p1 TRINITY_DN9958_c0_g1~~TRINITY_DN9958_c0_g1_i3.p1  ORF type:complete len:216 (+),score=42.75 TRINITY_DN9958_c0_g1_i3:136-783(+)